MNLLYFGDSKRQLFGAYHPPKSAARGAALICAPWGQEYIVSHRTNRRLAEQLSEVGYHVLRFDYYGTGDSAGDREEGTLESWYEDATIALQELRDMSGFHSAATFGIRLGAVVAWQLATRRTDVHTAVLWDPVVNGGNYVRELATVQAESDQWVLGEKPKSSESNAPAYLLGFPLSSDMRASVLRIEPESFGVPTKARVHLFYSDEFPERAPLHHSLSSAGTPFHFETLVGQTAWREEQATGAGVLPVRVIERMVEMVR